MEFERDDERIGAGESDVAFWALPVEVLLARLGTSSAGLTTQAAEEISARIGDRQLKRRADSPWKLLVGQFKSPIILLLFGSAVLSYALNDPVNAGMILVILLASGLLSFWQEWSAADAVQRLLAVIQAEATVLRDGMTRQIPLHAVVPGDVILLSAGDVIPGDGRLLAAQDLFVNEAALTGESFPAEKGVGLLERRCPLSRRTNAVFLGAHVMSGTGQAVMVATGAATEFGRVSARLDQRPPESGFERGLRDFGNLLIKITLSIVVVVFAVKVATQRPLVESLLVGLASAVGMTPQLLPAITGIVMAFGAKAMAREQVIVKQLVAIENFGSMTVLCADKTGTLTEGEVRLHATFNSDGEESERVARLAYFNAAFQTGFSNPIDRAIRQYRPYGHDGVERLDEVPQRLRPQTAQRPRRGAGPASSDHQRGLRSAFRLLHAARTADGGRCRPGAALDEAQADLHNAQRRRLPRSGPRLPRRRRLLRH